VPQGDGAGGAADARRPATKPASATRKPKVEAGLPPKPVWAPEPNVAPKVAVLPEPATEFEPPPIPNWDRASASKSWPDARREHASATSRPPVPADAGTHQGRPRRSRAFTRTVVLASLLVVFCVVTVALVLLHHSDNATTGPRATAAVVSHDVGRLKTATQAINADTSAARSTLHALSGIPTVGRVAVVLNPYVSSLQHFQTVLSGVDVPKSARGAAASVRASVSKDVRSLATINGLAPLHLGSYLEGFGTGANQLQQELGTLEHKLRASTR